MRSWLGLAVIAVLFVAGVASWFASDGDTAQAKTATPAERDASPTVESSLADTVREPLLDAEPEDAEHGLEPDPTNTASEAPPDDSAATSEQLELLLAGHVVDIHGEPVADAAVELLALRPGDGASRELWLRIGVHADTDVMGSFQIFGSETKLISQARVDPPRFAISANAPGYGAGEELECRLGQLDLRIVLDLEGRITGEFAHAEAALRPTQIRLFAERESDTAGLTRISRRATIDGQRLDGARFEIGGLSAGSWNVVVRLHDGQELARVDRVSVQSGETTRDARLLPLRVESRGTFEISIFLPDGSPASDASVLLVGIDGSPTLPMKLGAAGLGVFLAKEEPGGITLAISHSGTRTERLEHVKGPTRVDLRPAISVELELENVPELERDGLGLALTIFKVPEAGDGGRQEHVGGTVRLSMSEKPRLTLASPGDFAWIWSAVRSNGTERGRWADPGEPTIRVLDANEPQVLRIRAPDGLWEKLAAGR